MAISTNECWSLNFQVQTLNDAGDVGLARQAAADNGASPGLDAETMAAILSGDINPMAAWRKACGFTQADLSARSGVRLATISDIEGGKIDPRVSTIKSLAAALGVDIDDIV